MALWVAAVSVENEGESVAWRHYGLSAWVMPISRVFIATTFFQDLVIIENLKDHIRDII